MDVTRRGMMMAPLGLLIPWRSAQAADAMDFDSAKFLAAQKAGLPILVDITAPWCPTCWVQKPMLAILRNEDRFAKLQIFVVDFDSQKDAVRAFGARTQSTLIAYKGVIEVGRSVGDTHYDTIAALAAKAL